MLNTLMAWPTKNQEDSLLKVIQLLCSQNVLLFYAITDTLETNMFALKMKQFAEATFQFPKASSNV